ncbi:retrovirus-related pol polyprotein from transposon TNT 1-94 [Tanacetum coccineum]
MKAIIFTNTSVDDIGIDDSSRYPPDEFLQEDDPSRQYRVDSDVSFYIIPHGHSLTELTQENQVPEVIAPNKPEIPHTEDTDLINIDGTHEQNDRWSRDQHIKLVNIISDPGEGMVTRSMAAKLTTASARWVNSMQEELNQLYRNKVWTLVPLPYGKTAIGSKWVFRNKKDEHVARMEAIGIFLAFATYMNFKVYQMDVKSTFLNGKLKEEVYVKQPPGFESSEFPDYDCMLDKALYGLKQAPKACPMCKILVQSKGITSNGCEKNPQSAKKQQSVAMSSAEAEYVAVTGCCARDIELHFILTEYQLADIFTKPLDEPTFTRLKAELGMLNID